MLRHNESMRIDLYRIRFFGLARYFCSCFLGMMEPNCETFQRTLSILEKSGDRCLFIDD